MTEDDAYILTEIWKARPSWQALAKQDRLAFFEGRIDPLIGRMIEAGAELLGCAINDNDGAERIDYDYMAVWKMPDRQLGQRLEAEARTAGFLDYFEQVNFSGALIPPDVMNAAMIER